MKNLELFLNSWLNINIYLDQLAGHFDVTNVNCKILN